MIDDARLRPMIDKYKIEVEEKVTPTETSQKRLEAKFLQKPKLDHIIETEPEPYITAEEIRKPEFDVTLINPSGQPLARQPQTWSQEADSEIQEQDLASIPSQGVLYTIR